MTIAALQLNNSTPVTGLGEQEFDVTTTGFYTVSVVYFLPYRASGSSLSSSSTTGDSALQVLVKLNSTTKLTLSSPASTQPTLSGKVTISATAGDAIKVTPSSAATADNQLNAVKGVITIFQGIG